MTLTIIEKMVTNTPDGKERQIMVQFMVKETSGVDYMSGTVKLPVEKIGLTNLELEEEVSKVIKKALFPEPFNSDKIEELSEKITNFETENVQTFSLLSLQMNKVIAHLFRSEMTEDEYADIVKVYPEWQRAKEYSVGEVVRYENKAYEVIQAHTSQEEWKPNIEESLFKEITPNTTVDEDGEEVDVIDDWSDRGGSNGYKKGTKVKFKDTVYESLVGNNVYSPTEAPDDWKVIPK